MKDIFIEGGEAALVILLMLGLIWLFAKFMNNNSANWKEYLKRLVPENPVPIITAIGLAVLGIVFFLIIKTAVSYLHVNDPPPKKSVPGLELPAPER